MVIVVDMVNYLIVYSHVHIIAQIRTSDTGYVKGQIFPCHFYSFTILLIVE